MSLVRDHLLQIYRAALTAVQGESCMQRALARHHFLQPVAVVAIGKAASSMMLGAHAALGDKFHAGLLITKDGHCDVRLQGMENVHCLEAGHPVPDQRSLRAGQTLRNFIDETPAQRNFVFLISGGASSLVEVLPEGMGLSDLQRVNQWLLASGWNIVEMNRVRKSLSCIKGGRLAQWFTGRHVNCLMISDVLDNAPQTIGSGFFSPGLCSALPAADLPEWITALPAGPPAPLSGDACFKNIEIKIIANLNDAMQAAKKAAEKLGYKVCLHKDFVAGDAQLAGQQLARELRSGDCVLHVWGGETTVRLPDNPGRGGRNQHLALSAAVELEAAENNYFLAAGTDGSDGPTPDAGALVDAHTIQRGIEAGFDVQQTLCNANSGDFLQASGDLIVTGPTGTNVMDLMLAIKAPTT